MSLKLKDQHFRLGTDRLFSFVCVSRPRFSHCLIPFTIYLLTLGTSTKASPTASGTATPQRRLSGGMSLIPNLGSVSEKPARFLTPDDHTGKFFYIRSHIIIICTGVIVGVEGEGAMQLLLVFMLTHVYIVLITTFVFYLSCRWCVWAGLRHADSAQARHGSGVPQHLQRRHCLVSGRYVCIYLRLDVLLWQVFE